MTQPIPSPAARTTAHRSPGFSLVEVLVLIVMISILIGFSGMALFSWMGRADLKRAARTVVSMCQTARVEAIKQNTPVGVVFNNATNTCSVYTADGDGDWATEADNTLFRRFDISDSRSPIVIANATALTYEFSTRGRSKAIPSSAGVSGSLRLVNSATNSSLKVTLRSTGSIIIE